MKHITLFVVTYIFLYSCNSAPKNVNSDDSDIKFKEEYSSMPEAEEKLLAALDSHYSDESDYSTYRMPNYELIDFIFDEPQSLSYAFPKLSKSDYVNITTSDDGNLRFYYWDTGLGGTMTDWDAICQFRDGKDIYTIRGTNCLENENYDDVKNRAMGSEILDIATLYTDTGEKIYLVRETGRISSGWMVYAACAIKIKNGRIHLANIFNIDGKKTNSVGCDYSVEWDEKIFMEERWDWVVNFNKKTKTLYVPVGRESVLMTDRYALYHFNGKEMEYVGEDAGYWLHPSLHQFRSVVFLYRTRSYTIRVDEMPDGSYRYASWNRGKKISQQPDLVLYDGILYEGTDLYMFYKDSYMYEVSLNGVSVYQEGTCLLNQDALYSEI